MPTALPCPVLPCRVVPRRAQEKKQLLGIRVVVRLDGGIGEMWVLVMGCDDSVCETEVCGDDA